MTHSLLLELQSDSSRSNSCVLERENI